MKKIPSLFTYHQENGFIVSRGAVGNFRESPAPGTGNITDLCIGFQVKPERAKQTDFDTQVFQFNDFMKLFQLKSGEVRPGIRDSYNFV